MIRAVDHCPMKLTLADALYRAQYFAICTGGVEDYVEQMRAANPNVKLYGYLRPTHPELSWTKYVQADYFDLTAGCRAYVKQFDLDGIFLDTVFEYSGDWRDVMALIVGIENAIAPKHCMVNLGSADKLMATMDSDPLACSMFGVLREFFVQVAVQPREANIFLPFWKQTLKLSLMRCNSGKKVTLGIYDPNGLYPEIACLAHSAYHPNLSFHYHTAVPPAVGGPETQWPALWEQV